MNNKKKIAIAAFVVSILSLLPLIILPSSITSAMVVVGVGILFAIAGVILGFIGKSGSKGLSISAIVIGIISCLVLCLSLLGLSVIKSVTDCVDNGDGFSTCTYMGEEIELPNEMLTDDQMKK